MERTILIGGGEVHLRANAATPIYYRNMFHDDLLAHLGEEESGGTRTEVLMRLCFVEHMQAMHEPKDLRRIGEEQFLAWLEHFEWSDLVDAGAQAVEVWTGQSESTSTLKNAEAEKAEG